MKEKIIRWLKVQIKSARAKGVVVGLSGGLDSAVVGVLCRKALGKSKVLALILPCHSQNKDIEDALNLAKKFDIKTRLVDLSDIYDNLIKILPKADRISRANLKARLRMVVLYYFANKLNYLVCGTSNKSELMSGYFTKFGDGAADILPIGDLFKTQVRVLARQLNIPLEIIKKTPSAGLWPSQSDEEELGISYEELDDILKRLLEKKKQILSKEKVEKVKERIVLSEHKRNFPKICLFNRR